MSSDADKILTAVLVWLTATLLVWWTMADFFPQLGLTYWGLLLPTLAAMTVFGGLHLGQK